MKTNVWGIPCVVFDELVGNHLACMCKYTVTHISQNKSARKHQFFFSSKQI